MNRIPSARTLFPLTAALLGAGVLISAAQDAAPRLVVPDGKAYKGRKIIARVYDSHFALGHDSYNSMGTGSDGKTTTS